MDVYSACDSKRSARPESGAGGPFHRVLLTLWDHPRVFAAGYTRIGLARLYRRLGAAGARVHLRDLRNKQRKVARGL